MNVKQIKELAQLLKQNDLSALEIVEGDSRIRLERDIQVVQTQPVQRQIEIQVPSEPISPAPVQPAKEPGMDFNKLHEVKCPLVGVFYAAPSPESDPFVKIGSQAKKGDVLCIVEAMKLMNEIVAERDGEIVDICVQNGDVVEFGQTLFKLS